MKELSRALVCTAVLAALAACPSALAQRSGISPVGYYQPCVEKAVIDRPQIDRPTIDRPNVLRAEMERPDIGRPKIDKAEFSKTEVLRAEVLRPEFADPCAGGMGSTYLSTLRLTSATLGLQFDKAGHVVQSSSGLPDQGGKATTQATKEVQKHTTFATATDLRHAQDAAREAA